MTEPAALRWFTAAAVLGTLHGVASLYWALGGSALVGTVGAWALAWRRESPVTVGLVLAAIAAAKLAGAWVPWVAARRGGPRGALRRLCWAGAALLTTYGLANTVAANLALTGAIGPVDDLVAMRGHAWLWDPLFLAWGVTLGIGLSRTRRPTRDAGEVRSTEQANDLGRGVERFELRPHQPLQVAGLAQRADG